ncbi:glycosyltransferase [Gryllotalpicola koreensis]|uniref:glycosyltransferase n=1 Tax=Gryllotalpicola koreensis TaxID=993086 RepID=UPI0031D32683
MHFERASEMAPGLTLYLKRRADFDEALAANRPDFLSGTLREIIRRVLVSRPRVLEVPEPLWFRYWPHTMILLIALRLASGSRRREISVVTYAIENSTPDRLPRRLATLPPALWRTISRILARGHLRHVDRIAFGTSGARQALITTAGLGALQDDHLQTRIIEALPTRCACTSPSEERTDSVVFVTSLEQRKGLDTLLEAWPAVVAARPTAMLHIAGSGPLEGATATASATYPSIVFHGLVGRETVHSLYRHARVSVLPSRPSGRWREQVGLPIVEGISHGTSIVTTAETGLARWLTQHGQHVLTELTPRALATAIIEALAVPAPRYALPLADGRILADGWLIGRAPGVFTPPKDGVAVL